MIVGPAGDTRHVARRMTSPTLVGRAAELAALRAATDAASAGHARIVLIGGDAGIGKTRLVTEFRAQARAAGFRTAIGGCVQLGDVAIAYAPMVEALREVGRELGPEAFAELVGHGREELDGLIGGRGTAASSGPGPLFEHLRALLTRLGEQQPIVLVLEDMHWADASTRALIAYLGRNLRDTRVVLVLTYRSDELHRRHPLRPLLTDLERDPQVERIRLSGLSRAELVELLTGIGEASPEVDELLSRTEGNPFYVEEIVAAGARVLPDTLAEVVLSRVSRLSEPTQELLHRAAVLGDEVDERLLAALTGDSAEAVTGALREAVFEQLLVIDAEGCRFRHALIREALYDDLLPGERERLHVAAAHAVQDPAVADRLDEHVRWAMLAHHWHAAREPDRAFAASVRAGVEAENVRAHADSAAHYERALQLWDRIPDPVTAAGMSRAELFDRAAHAVHWSSHSWARATTLARAALDALGPDASPETRALQLVRLGRMHWIGYDGRAEVAAYDQAVTLLADRPASAEQAYTLAAQGQSLMLRGMSSAAEPVLRKAFEVASTVGPGTISAGAVAGHALCSLGPVLVDLGRIDEAIETMRRAEVLSRADGNPADVSRCYTNHAHVLLLAGRFAELDSLAVEGMAYATATGHLRHYGESIIGIWGLALYAAGRWAEAEARIRSLLDRVTPEDPYLILRWLPLLIGQAGSTRHARLWTIRSRRRPAPTTSSSPGSRTSGPPRWPAPSSASTRPASW
jgi:tetratricopeptide (TPR) repeat protein